MTDPVRTQVTKGIQTHQRTAFRKSDLSPFSDATISTFVFNIKKNIKKISITCRYVKSMFKTKLTITQSKVLC